MRLIEWRRNRDLITVLTCIRDVWDVIFSASRAHAAPPLLVLIFFAIFDSIASSPPRPLTGHFPPTGHLLPPKKITIATSAPAEGWGFKVIWLILIYGCDYQVRVWVWG